jgi:RNase adaptor protein for sRNA GlmZ degradation
MPPRLISFGYRHGPPPAADVVVDVRALSPDLSHRAAARVRTRIADALHRGQSVAVGCDEGQHRSVHLVQDCQRWMPQIPVTHRDQRPATPAVRRPSVSRRLRAVLDRVSIRSPH